MATQIFTTYSAFAQREDRSLNGVSPEFAKLHPDYESENASNSGCWDCGGCTDCWSCTYCMDCKKCTDCTYCWRCTDCAACIRCIRCIDCTGCTQCECCSHSTDCSGWIGGRRVTRVTRGI